MQILKSEIDDSVNFIKPYGKGIIESRYVRRNKDKVAFYISSDIGCNQLCKFCHLTATKQFPVFYLTKDQIIDQVKLLADYYQENSAPAKKIHINFMARGEPLLNPEIRKNHNRLTKAIQDIVTCEINISTIIPKSLKHDDDVFFNSDYNFYYSLYSTNEQFRATWMPNALDLQKAFFFLKLHQEVTNNQVTIHHALIKNENDNEEDAENLADIIYKYLWTDLTRVSLIEYNPYSPNEGEESDNYIAYKHALVSRGIEVKHINRVGFDVKASCGMFV